MSGSRWLKVGALLGVALATACGDDEGDSSGAGDLGFASFHWHCAGSGDTACESAWVAGFPRLVARGSVFTLGFQLYGVPRQVRAAGVDLAGSSRAEPSSRGSGRHDYDYDFAYGDETTSTFRALEEGSITMLALAGDDAVADFITLSVVPLTSLAVVRDCDEVPCEYEEEDGTVVEEGRVGESIGLRAEPYASGDRLVGHLDYEWTSLDPEVAELSRSHGREATLELRRAGTAYVRVRVGNHADTVALAVVSEGPTRRRPGPPSETGGDTDTGTGTESDTGMGTESGTGTGTDTGTESDTDTATGTTTGGMQ